MISLNENSTGRNAVTKPGLDKIEKAAASYAELRNQVATIVDELTDKIEALKKEKMPMIKKLAKTLAAKHVELETAIAGAPHLFEKPRTVVFSGIKCGFRKNEGTIAFDDAELTVNKIEQ